MDKETRKRTAEARRTRREALAAEQERDKALVLDALRAVLQDPESTAEQRIFAVAVLDKVKRHGLPHIHAHAFRHTVASVLISSGTDIVTVSKRLGHARTSTTTDIYSHVIQEADAQASECIADVLLQRKKA